MADNEHSNVKIRKAKGRPMLTWVGKRPLSRVKAYPAQHIESFSAAMQDLVEGEYELDLPLKNPQLQLRSSICWVRKSS